MSLRNAGDVGRPSIVGKNVRVRLGVKAIGSGVVPKKETRKPLRLMPSKLVARR